MNDDVFTEANLHDSVTTIGKSPDSSIVLPGWNIAKLHASLIINDDELFIQDNGGMFGTFVNDSRITHYGPVKNTDVIRIGAYTISVYISHSQIPSHDSSAVVNRNSNNVRPVNVATEIEPLNINKGKLYSVNTNEVDEYRIVPISSVENSDKLVPVYTGGDYNSEKIKKINNVNLGKIQTNQFDFDKWRKTVHESVLHEMDARRVDAIRLKDDELRSNVRLIIKEVIDATHNIPPNIDLVELAKQVLDEAVGLGPLEPLLSDDSVSEIMLNKYDEIWIERKGQLTLSSSTFSSDSAVLGAIERIVTPLGRRIDESSPMVDARLKDGSRVNAIISPLSLRGPSLTIRKFSKTKLTAEDYINFGSLTKEMVELLVTVVKLRLNIVVSGGTGTGKTSFLNMIAGFINETERVLTIEDAAELKLPQPNLVSLESRPPNLEGKGGVSIRDLLRNSLRMRPDRIIVGECRGGEALDMLQAMNTGHDGSMTTLHSNSPRDALARLEVLVLMAGVNLPVRAIREQIASAVHVVIQLSRFSCGARKITSITEIIGMEGDVMQTNEIFRFKKTGRSAEGYTTGDFVYSGIKPEFMNNLEQ